MILLDTDILIDVALDRRPHSGPASELLDQIEHGGEAAYVAWHSVSNLYYVVAPALGGVSTRDFIVELTRFVAVATTDTEGIRYAAELPMADFEDAMQVAAARACGARHKSPGTSGTTTALQSVRSIRRRRSVACSDAWRLDADHTPQVAPGRSTPPKWTKSITFTLRFVLAL